MLDVIVRRLAKNDVADFYNLRLQSLQECPSSFLSSYEEERNAGSCFFENILASKGIYQEQSFKAAHKCKIWGMYVQADYRGHAVGKKLLEIAITHAKERMHCLIVNLTVEKNNVAAKNLYESYGFKVWGTEIRAIRIDQKFYDELHMALLF